MAAKHTTQPPTFGSVESERLHRRQRLAAAFRLYAALTQTQVGSPGIGWFSFQPLWERIVREQPELLD